MKRFAWAFIIGLAACTSSVPTHEAKLNGVRAAIATATTADEFLRVSDREGMTCSRVACDHLCLRNYATLRSSPADAPDQLLQCIWHAPPKRLQLVSAAVQSFAYLDGERIVAKTAENVFTGP